MGLPVLCAPLFLVPLHLSSRSAPKEHSPIHDYGAVQQEIEWEPDLCGEDFEAQRRDQGYLRKDQRAGSVCWRERG